MYLSGKTKEWFVWTCWPHKSTADEIRNKMNMNTLDSHPWQASQPACQIFQSPKFNSSSRREKKGHIKNERHVVCEVELASWLAGRQWQYLPHSMLAPSLRDWKLMRKGNQHATERERDGRERERRGEKERKMPICFHSNSTMALLLGCLWFIPSEGLGRQQPMIYRA